MLVGLQLIMSKRLKLSSQFLPHKNTDSSHSFDEDPFSPLPDEILVTILSHLTLRETAQTSILSHRWKMLWTFTTGNLDFDAPDVLCKINTEKNLALWEKDRRKYSTWVNQVLKSHKGSIVDSFRIRFNLDNTHNSNLDSWIDFAIQKRVMRLEVELRRLFNNHRKDIYPFPKQVLGFTNIKFLRGLRLNYVDVSGPVLEDLLSKCPSLEALIITSSPTLLCHKICGALSLKLKFIEIQSCLMLEYLEVSAGNLMALTYSGPNISLVINHAPKLDCMGDTIASLSFPCFASFPPFSLR